MACKEPYGTDATQASHTSTNFVFSALLKGTSTLGELLVGFALPAMQDENEHLLQLSHSSLRSNSN